MFHITYNVIFYTLVTEQLLTRTGIIYHSCQWYCHTNNKALQPLIKIALENGVKLFKTWRRLYTIIWNSAFMLVVIYGETEKFIILYYTENVISFSINVPHIEIKCIKPLHQQRCWSFLLLNYLRTISRG